MTTNAVRGTFTEYVQSLESPFGLEDAARIAAVWSALGRALRGELKRRGLWHAHPSYLGVYGWESWYRPGSAEKRLREDGFDPSQEGALHELLAECYTFIFISRLQSLKAHLKAKPNIDGLVYLNVRHFVHDRQKKHDPIGFRVFESLQIAVLESVEAAELHVVAGDSRIRNDTVLSSHPDASPSQAETRDLSPLVRGWNEDLPNLVTARGKEQRRAVAVLRRHLRHLPQQGIEVFRFGDVIDPLKQDVRARWVAVLELEGGETLVERNDSGLATVVHLVHPSAFVEDQDTFDKLVAAVTDLLDDLEESDRTRYLRTLWQYLVAYAAAPAGRTVAGGTGLPSALAASRLPSDRKLAEWLQIPRARLPKLSGTLGEMVRQARATISEKRPLTQD